MALLQTLTFDADAETLDYTMPTSGVYCCDITRSTGDGTFTLQVSVDGGSNFVDFHDVNGVLQQVAMTSSRPHTRFEAIGRKGTVFRVLSSSTASTPSFPAKAGLAGFMAKSFSE